MAERPDDFRLDPLGGGPGGPVDDDRRVLVPVSAGDVAALRQASVASLGLAMLQALVGFLIGSVSLVALAVDALRDGASSGLALVLSGGSRGLYRAATALVALMAAALFLWVVAVPFIGFGGAALPNPWIMIAAAVVSLAVNVFVAFRLRGMAAAGDERAWVFRQARWDFVADLGVVLAALAVHDLVAAWPDRLAGIVIGVLSLVGIARLLRDLWRSA